MGNLHDIWSKKIIVTNFYEVNHYFCLMLLGFCFLEEDVFTSVVSCLSFKSLRFWISWNRLKHVVFLSPIFSVRKLTRHVNQYMAVCLTLMSLLFGSDVEQKIMHLCGNLRTFFSFPGVDSVSSSPLLFKGDIFSFALLLFQLLHWHNSLEISGDGTMFDRDRFCSIFCCLWPSSVHSYCLAGFFPSHNFILASVTHHYLLLFFIDVVITKFSRYFKLYGDLGTLPLIGCMSLYHDADSYGVSFMENFKLIIVQLSWCPHSYSLGSTSVGILILGDRLWHDVKKINLGDWSWSQWRDHNTTTE